MKIFVDGTVIYIDCILYDPFPNIKGDKIMINPDEEDPQDSEDADNDGTGRPGTGE